MHSSDSSRATLTGQPEARGTGLAERLLLREASNSSLVKGHAPDRFAAVQVGDDFPLGISGDHVFEESVENVAIDNNGSRDDSIEAERIKNDA